MPTCWRSSRPSGTRRCTARTVHLRVRAVLEWAIAMDWRTDNPCDRLLPVLGPQRDVVEHRRALPHRDVAAAIERVRTSDPAKVDTLAFEFLVLTAARGGEVPRTCFERRRRLMDDWASAIESR